MAVKRRKLPYKVVDSINSAVLSKYRQVSFVALNRIKEILATQTSMSEDEIVLQQLVKSVPRENELDVYDKGDKVLVQVGDEWKPAMVLGFSGGLKVQREDGAIRVIQDLAKVAKIPGEAVGSGIFLSRFGVRIPEGTKSYAMEKSLERITEEMNSTPLLVNKETWRRNLFKLAEELAVLEDTCKSMTGNPDFRPNSPKDCIEEFQGKRKLPLGRITEKGAQSMDKEALQYLANLGDDLAPVVMQARETQSKVSQLTKWAPFAQEGSVQTNWDQYGQPHGRYTSDNPNLQNRVSEIRETIESSHGYSFVSTDWGMAEYVVWASLSKDGYLSEIFEMGRDLHEEMGKALVNLNPARTLGSDTVRKFGKTTNFAILYRMQPWTLAKSLGVSSGEAATILDEYATRAPVASEYQEEVLRKAARDGYVDTAFGRRLYCSALGNLRGGQLHQLQKTVWHHHNAGTAAELLKLKMVEVEDALRKGGYSWETARIALNMHDEIILEVKDAFLEDVSHLIKSTMEAREEGFLPFKVDLRIGKNWLEISK